MSRVLDEQDRAEVVVRVGQYLSELGWSYSLKPKPASGLSDLLRGIPGHYADEWSSPEGHRVEIDHNPDEKGCLSLIVSLSRVLKDKDGELLHTSAAFMPHTPDDVSLLMYALHLHYALPYPEGD